MSTAFAYLSVMHVCLSVRVYVRVLAWETCATHVCIQGAREQYCT